MRKQQLGFAFKKIIAVGSTTVFTLLAAPLVADIAMPSNNLLMSAAHAADYSSSEAEKGSGKGSGSGQGSAGANAGGTRKGASNAGSGSDASSESGSDSASSSSDSGSSSSGSANGQGNANAGSGSGSSSSGGTNAGGANAGGSGSGQGNRGSSSGGSTGTVTTTEDDGGGTGQMGSGTHGRGSYQDNMQQGGSAAPGPGGINDEPNDAKGPRHSGGAETGSSGGKPVWAQEGIPEVELGRLNVARAPGKLLDKQLVEAIAALTESVVSDDSLYLADNLTDALALIANDVVRIDSPLANLALIKDYFTDGVFDGDYVTTDGETYMVFDPNMTDLDMAALLLGSAADKTVTITADTVAAMETILGVDLGDDSAVAEAADAVRAAILAAHED